MDACRSATLRKTPRRMALFVEVPDQSLDKIHPTGTGWGRSETRTGDDGLNHGLYFCVLVRSVVVHDQM